MGFNPKNLFLMFIDFPQQIFVENGLVESLIILFHFFDDLIRDEGDEVEAGFCLVEPEAAIVIG